MTNAFEHWTADGVPIPVPDAATATGNFDYWTADGVALARSDTDADDPVTEPPRRRATMCFLRSGI